MEKRLTAHLLRTLLDQHFDSKSDMARKLDVKYRVLQTAFQRMDNAKAGTIILDKALLYCAQHHISLDGITNVFREPIPKGGETSMVDQPQQPEAFNQLHISMPDDLTATGIHMYESMLRFVRRTSAIICPSCRTWCNPWNGETHVEQSDCYIGHIISVMMADICTLYTGEGES